MYITAIVINDKRAIEEKDINMYKTNIEKMKQALEIIALNLKSK